MRALIDFIDWQQAWQNMVDSSIAFAPKVIAALAVLLVFWIVFRVTRRALKLMLSRAGIHEALIRLLIDNVYRIVLLIIGGLMAISQLGINVGAALAGLGVIGVAVGLAAQDTIANLIAGFLIFWDKPFSVGDFLTVGSYYGEVREITMRTTRIRTQENTYVVIPNRQIMDSPLTNHSMYGATRVNVPLGIAYKEYIPDARRVLLEAVAGLDEVAGEPAPEVVVEELSGSSVNLTVRVWIEDLARERAIFFQTLEACKLALDAAGIQIPYPHLQLFVEKVEDPVWDKYATLRQA